MNDNTTNKVPNPVHVFIAAPLIGRIWVAIKNLCARFPGPLGSLHPLAVLELAPIIHGDGPENLPEFCPHAALHAVQRPDHAFHGMIRHPDDHGVTCQPLGQHH